MQILFSLLLGLNFWKFLNLDRFWWKLDGSGKPPCPVAVSVAPGDRGEGGKREESLWASVSVEASGEQLPGHPGEGQL